ncbi:DUF2975 domain-containing protein [Catenuloplanes japonicus]|uniref:DUF2975 domain-containing protein n=1 Tax=Catenuloplanes japonicus TaxID=33876 RepID=UPI000527026D|nr:DUF2975 domain-containing protein [Catenuloplanes japonicus]
MIDAHRDWLGELHTALVVGIGFGVLGGVATIGRAVVAGTVDLTIQTAGATGVTGLPAGVRLADGGGVEVTVTDPAWGERLLSALQGAPAYLLGLLIIVLLWRIVAVARRTDPFSPELPRRLRRLGVATLVLGVCAELAQVAIDAAASTVVYGEFWALSFRSGFWWLLLGFGLLAVAEVLRRGGALRAELDEVV